MYNYKYPIETPPKNGEAVYIETLKKEIYGYNLDVTLMGIDNDNKYFDYNVPKSKSEVIISSSVASKYNLKKGEMLVLKDELNDINYAFKIKEIVEKNIENPDFNIEQLASEVCMGRSAFFEKIKDITGTTPANFILECRLNKATALLIKNPTLRMDDIAAYLGFSSGRYFCKCFKNHFGISPLQYRKQDQG